MERPSVGVFICSSDNRRDILARVLPSIRKFWSNCPYPVYVGLNSVLESDSSIKSVVAEPSGWRSEVLHQIAQVPETHLIVVLDDFLIQEHVDQSRIDELVVKAVDLDLPYLRLLPLCKSLKQRLLPGSGDAMDEIQVIHKRRPFYSGLQIAIWRKEHFVALLQLRGSIWEFEHQQLPGVPHYVIADRPPVIYSHLVEKGQWLPYAESLLKLAGLSTDLGSRPSWPSWMNLRLILDKARFFLLGYANH